MTRRRSTAAFVGVVTFALLQGAAWASAQTVAPAESIRSWLDGYVAALNAKDLDRLGTFYSAGVTIFEGGGIDRGWATYRDRHLGPELREFEDLQFTHSNVTVHMLNDRAAYVTAEYSLRARVKGRPVDAGGLETLIVTQADDGAWRIRHAHTSSRRRPSTVQ